MLCTNSIQTPVTHTLYTKIVNIKETTLWDLIGLGFLSEVTPNKKYAYDIIFIDILKIILAFIKFSCAKSNCSLI